MGVFARRITGAAALVTVLTACGSSGHPAVLPTVPPDAQAPDAAGAAGDAPGVIATDAPDVTATDAPTVSTADGGADGGVAGSADQAIYRRLSNAEYDAAIRALFQITDYVVDADGRYGPRSVSRQFDLPIDPLVDDFDTDSATLVVTTGHADRYAAAAESLAAEFTAPAHLAAVVGCDVTGAGAGADACLHDFVVRFGRLALRRALRADEVADYTALAATGTDGPSRVAVVVQAMLQSPYFLYLIEGGRPDPAHGGRHRLDGYAMASRLAFTLWGTAPTDALLTQAEAGRFDTDAGVTAAAEAMLMDPAAQAGIQRFYTAWLRLYRLPWTQRDQNRYPLYTPRVARAAQQETSMVLDDLVARPGANFLDLFTSRTTFLFVPLAPIYGVAAPTAPYAAYTFTDADGRAGLLTQASYLMLTALANRNSPTLRGEYVRSVLLCQPLPPPPPGVSPLPVDDPTLTDRERFTMHSADPACASCHTQMDPIGFGIERFDPLGTRLPAGSGTAMLTERGQIAGFDPPDFTGPVALGQRLRASALVPSCIARKLFQFALGRPPGDGDRTDLAAMTTTFTASGYAFHQLVLRLAGTDAFLYREGVATTGGGAP